MSVAEFVAYSKSLIKAQPVRDRETAYYARLFGFKLSVKRRLKSLDVPKYRMAQFLAKYDLVRPRRFHKFRRDTNIRAGTAKA